MSTDENISKWQEKPVLMPRIIKTVVNISVGKSGEPLEKAMKILQGLAGQKPCKRIAKKTIREFGIRKREPVSCLVTLRREKAKEFLKKVLPAVDNRISGKAFDKNGNFSFGIDEHISIPGTKYIPELGIIGMDISVNLGRPGYRVKLRHRTKTKIGTDHLLTRNEGILFVKNMLGIEVT
jgi:large subunit ribosomal protein L5